MKHCSIKEITALKSGTLSRKERISAEKHISRCSRCSSDLKIISVIVSPSESKDAAEPSESVYNRVLSYYDKAVQSPPSDIPFMKRLPVRIAAAAVISIAVLSAALFYIDPFDSSTHIRTAQVKGTVKSGKKNLTNGRRLAAGSRVETGNNSHVALESGDLMKLNAGGQTSLLIKSARKEKNSGKTVFNVVMDKGTVSASFDKDKNLEYTFKTPHATITSRGSQILLKVEEDRTMLLMKSGSAEVSSSAGTNITAEEGNGYTILSDLSLNSSEDADIVHDGELSDSDDLIE